MNLRSLAYTQPAVTSLQQNNFNLSFDNFSNKTQQSSLNHIPNGNNLSSNNTSFVDELNLLQDVKSLSHLQSNMAAPIQMAAKEADNGMAQLLMIISQLLSHLNDAVTQSANSMTGKETNNSNKPARMIRRATMATQSPIRNMSTLANIGTVQGQEISKPTHDLSQFRLGEKPVLIGSDGGVFSDEVQASKQSILNMYQNSPTFRQLIDYSTDETFEITIGKRADNISWGNADGRIFINLNNIKPGDNTPFQTIVAHEMAHAAGDYGHGPELDYIQSTVAMEA